jgi:REP element-mobilizing transposase RayT
MPRLPRSALPEYGVYHVTARGVARSRIFIDDHDRTRFVRLLRSVTARFRWRCHAYCLMGNHYHLVVEGRLADLSAGAHRLNGGHARRFNERHERVGHLFQERFHARVLRDDEHLAAACTYVLDNPVRAGLSLTADAWRWGGRL